MNRPPIAPPPAAALPLAQLLGHAADAVQAVRRGTSLTEALDRCPREARPGTQAIAFDALRRLGAAEDVRRRLAPRRPPPAVEPLLLVAITLLWPSADGDAAPYEDHTVVDQAVRCAQQRPGASDGFVNAVLRRFVRERAAIVEAVEADPAARFNHPSWWIERLRRDWPGQWQAVLEADNARPPMALRVNAQRLDAAAYLERLADAGIRARAAGSHAVVLDMPRPVSALPGFDAGDVSVQDLNAQRAAPLLVGPGARRRLREGARVLDACAAPGGKTAHLLELAADLDVLAIDRDPERLVRVDDTLRRLGLRARTLAADAAEPAAWWDGRRFDAILLDAPCTASGIVRRHPDVRWLRRPGDVAALAAAQARLLDALAPLLAEGGRLLYCTCSVFRAEGQEQIDAFLQRPAGTRLVADPAAPGHLLPLADNDPANPASGDGFFYALLHQP